MRLINGSSLRAGSVERAPRREALTEQHLCGSGDGRSSRRVFEHDEVAVERVDDHRAGLEADEHAAEVVPRTVRVAAAVDVPVEAPAATAHRSRAAAPSARYCFQPRRRGGYPDSPTIASPRRRRRRRLRSARRSASRRRLAPPRTRSPVARLTTSAAERPLGIDGAQARGVPGDPAERVRRAVERIDDHDDVASGSCRPLSSDSTPTPAPSNTPSAASSAARSLWYWPGCVPPPASPQSVSIAQRGRSPRMQSRRAGSVSPASDSTVVGHGWRHRSGADRGRLVPMAVIDVAGFVADLKDHAVDHGFHVHDERHFVETYSLRQAWEVDLHPEEACGGPLDLHLSLEVDPRRCSRSRTRCWRCPTATKPPDEFHFPLMFTWALPPLPSAPTCSCSPPSSPASAARSCRSRCRPSTRSPRSPTRPSAASRRRPHRGRPRPRLPRRGAAVRRARPLPRRQPVPARPRAQLARRGLTRPDARGISRHFAVTRRTDRTI